MCLRLSSIQVGQRTRDPSFVTLMGRHHHAAGARLNKADTNTEDRKLVSMINGRPLRSDQLRANDYEVLSLAVITAVSRRRIALLERHVVKEVKKKLLTIPVGLVALIQKALQQSRCNNVLFLSNT